MSDGLIELPVLNHFGHTGRPSSAPSSSSRFPDVLASSVAVKESDLRHLQNDSSAVAGLSSQLKDQFGAEEMDVGRAAVDHDETDPLLLRSKIVGEGEMSEIRNRKKDKGRSKKTLAFYSDQNQHILSLLKPLKTLREEGEEAEENSASMVKWAVYLSFYSNCLLACLQLYAAISSLSLSLFATAMDSVFDPFANVLLNVLHKKARKVDMKKWPMGGSRFESSDGNVVYGSLMAMVNVILIVESIRSLATRKDDDETKLHIPSLVAVGVAFVVKFGLFLFCYSIRHQSSQVQVLFEDHRNDLFVNGFGIFTSAAGAKIAWWIDPMGAMIIAVAIIGAWCKTIYEQFRLLAGIAAPIEFQRLVIYKAMTFDPAIKQIDSCHIYHSGPNYFVEIDIVMDGEMPLWKAHDLAQDLQDQIEALKSVDRCFVHVDHETSHKPEHRKHQ